MQKAIGKMVSIYNPPYPSFEVQSLEEDELFFTGLAIDGESFDCRKIFWEYTPYTEAGASQESFDMVEKPKHYQVLPGVEVRDVLKALVAKIEANKSLTAMQVADYVQLMQYLLRFMDKNGDEDLAKAKVYLDWLVESRKGE